MPSPSASVSTAGSAPTLASDRTPSATSSERDQQIDAAVSGRARPAPLVRRATRRFIRSVNTRWPRSTPPMVAAAPSARNSATCRGVAMPFLDLPGDRRGRRCRARSTTIWCVRHQIGAPAAGLRPSAVCERADDLAGRRESLRRRLPQAARDDVGERRGTSGQRPPAARVALEHARDGRERRRRRERMRAAAYS